MFHQQTNFQKYEPVQHAQCAVFVLAADGGGAGGRVYGIVHLSFITTHYAQALNIQSYTLCTHRSIVRGAAASVGGECAYATKLRVLEALRLAALSHSNRYNPHAASRGSHASRNQGRKDECKLGGCVWGMCGWGGSMGGTCPDGQSATDEQPSVQYTGGNLPVGESVHFGVPWVEECTVNFGPG